MTPADELRQAATKAREVAGAATPGPWDYWEMLPDGRLEVFVPDGTMSAETVLEFKDHMDCEECIRPSVADADHLILVHPGVTLLLADLLDVIAADVGSSTLAFHAAADLARLLLATPTGREQ